MHERLKLIRKKLGLTQEEFGNRIGVKRNTIATYEIGRNEPIDAIIFSICRIFSVNENWLRTGQGNMFITKPNDIIDSLVQEYGFGNVEKAILTEYIALDDDGKKTLMNFIVKIGETAKRFDKDSWLVGDKNFKSWESATEEDIKIAEEILREEMERKDKGGA
ncbi:MAG: helix-turn-helix transcriptional regulator [Lachnospiraceae bacterium]|nr:helix-turn-helix transcriptional regulator [Lachnospiraceae bacterium]